MKRRVMVIYDFSNSSYREGDSGTEHWRKSQRVHGIGNIGGAQLIKSFSQFLCYIQPYM